MRMPSLFAVVLVALSTRAASAQEERFDVQAFRPLGSPQDVVGVDQSRALSPHSASAGVFLHFALDPLVLRVHGSDVKALSVVGPRLQLDLLASVGVADGVEAGLTVPLVLAQGSDNLEAISSEGTVRSFALGDVRLRGKVAVPGLRRRAEDSGWGAALTLGVGLPTGSREAFAGEGALTWMPGAVVDYRFDSGALLALDAGLWLRPTHEFLGVRWGNAATVGLGAEVPVLRGLGVTAVGTLTGSTPLVGQPGLARQVPVEGLVGLRWYSPLGLTVTVGGGGGCGCSLTAPTLRLFSSVVWVPYRGSEWHALERYKRPPRPAPPASMPPLLLDVDGEDSDGDGVVDRRDVCPRHAAGPGGREGCPRVREEDGRLVTRGPVRFATGQEVLLPDSVPVLEEVAAVLLSRPEVRRVRVVATTDPGDSGALALALAHRRAATVRRHLLDSGVAEERLCAVGRTRERWEGDTGQHLEFVVESGSGPLPPCTHEADTSTPSPAWEMEGTKEVRTRAWAAARGLTRLGAWLALGLRVEGERVRLLRVRAHEGSGAEVGAVKAEDVRPLLEWALYRYARGREGEVVLTLRRGLVMWTEEEESTGPVLQATTLQAPHEVFLRNQREKLQVGTVSEEARREGLTALKKLEGWLLLQPDSALERTGSPLTRYAELMEEERQREVRWRAVQRKLAEYEQWGKRLLATYSAPPHRVAPGYLVSESPLRERSLRALGDATLAWAYAHTEDPDFLERTPDQVALYLLASRSALATVVHLGRMAPVHLDYTEAFDPEVYTTDELVLELLVGLAPGAGEVTDAHAAFSGRSLTGHQLSPTERVLCAVGVLLPFVTGKVLKDAGEAGLQRFALLTGRSLDEVRVLSRVAARLSPENAREVERLMVAASKGHTFTEEEMQFLQRVAHGLEAPLREAAEALRAGQKVPLLGARTLADGSRLLPGSPSHKAQRWIDYQFRHPEKYRHFSFQPDADWARMYETILENRPAGNAFEDAILQAGKYERNTAMMLPPPGSGARGFMPDSVKGSPVELVWGQPYPFVEAKARKVLSLSGNLEAMLGYVETYGGHIELWVRSSRHPDGATHLSKPLLRVLNRLKTQGKAAVKPYP
ncbi:pre-toxin TG domain-containing protein [Archangium lipolyticum]|uniref:pre-toxin TG domain-containing protein n=1 Tax=Archangium lipolyticum TaxID=2970465 RepID=UPI00214A6590|nr:OmpA family protein [Archangium lipolyticum]